MPKKSPYSINKTACCGSRRLDSNPDHTKEIHRLNRIAGQVDGIKRMITEREYCPKIINQIQAVRAALKSLETVVLEKHLASCVQDALSASNSKDVEKKMSELIQLFRRG